MLRFNWFLPRYLGLGAALVAWPGCGAADNDGDLDVLSALPDGRAPPDLSDGGAPPQEANTSPNCAADTLVCTTCRTVTMCLGPWLDCTRDGQCNGADKTATSCVCNAQMTNPVGIASCQTVFRATGTPAAALTDCIVSRCASECGL